MSDAKDAEGAADLGWYSVRCVFHGGADMPDTYEERMTLWRAGSFDAAIAQAEAEAAEYAEEVGGTYLGFAQAYHLFDEPGHGAEVYSLMRDSELAPEAYLTAFFDTGQERQETLGEAAGDR